MINGPDNVDAGGCVGCLGALIILPIALIVAYWFLKYTVFWY